MGQAPFRELSQLIAQMRRLTSVSVSKRLAVVGTSLPAYKVLFRLVHDREVLRASSAHERNPLHGAESIRHCGVYRRQA